MKNCTICGSISNLYLEEDEGSFTCIECICKSSLKCLICNENVGITNIDRANNILGDDWVEMCENCAIEFKKKCIQRG
jgi:hypothetical protein